MGVNDSSLNQVPSSCVDGPSPTGTVEAGEGPARLSAMALCDLGLRRLVTRYQVSPY